MSHPSQCIIDMYSSCIGVLGSTKSTWVHMGWPGVSSGIMHISQPCTSPDLLVSPMLVKWPRTGAVCSVHASAVGQLSTWRCAGTLSAMHYSRHLLSLSLAERDVCGDYGMHLSTVSSCVWHE